MLRMDQVHVIRHKVLRERLSVRAVARQMGLSRNTVAKYLQVPEPHRHGRRPRPRPVLERVAPHIEELLQEWRGRTTAKQRLTGARLHRQLVEEGYQVGITTVRDYLWEKRRQAAEVYIPLVRRPGEEGQVDFFQVTVDEGEWRRQVWKFLLHLPYSGRDFLWLYDRCDQLSFLDGHVRAAEYLGGLPRRLVYERRRRIFEMREDGTYSLEEFQERRDAVDTELAAANDAMASSLPDDFDPASAIWYAAEFLTALGHQWGEFLPGLRSRFQRLVLPAGITYARDSGFGTAQLGPIYELNQRFLAANSKEVSLAGLDWNQLLQDLREVQSFEDTAQLTVAACRS